MLYNFVKCYRVLIINNQKITKVMNLRFKMGKFVIQGEVAIITYKLEKNVTFKGNHDLHIFFFRRSIKMSRTFLQNEFKQ